ncbi:hypothetical protein [Streptomyces sp. NPDC017202]|uniref:hypothetical protein n=1 Tax=Streptomyces sp. NPDC017202 TaxID=3364981 RepID=UPI0037A56BAC
MPLTLPDLLARTALTARLGPVRVGASWADVTALLGEPREVLRSRRWPRLYGHGDLEALVCRCGRVLLVTVRAGGGTVELPTVEGAFPGEPTEAEVVAALDRAGCPWEADPAHTFGDQRGLRVPATSALFVFVVPGSVVPGSVVPGSVVPGSVVPGSAVPGSAVPGDRRPRLHSLGLPGDGYACPD